MLSLFLPPSNRAQSAAELTAMLEDASEELLRLRECTASLAESPESTVFCPRQLQSLRSELDRGRGLIAARMAALGGSRSEGAAAAIGTAAKKAEPRKVRARTLMRTYGKCSHQLCRVVQEARRISDSTTAAMLSDLILRMEKQLWLLDAPSQQREPASRRVVAFYFSC